MTATTRQITPVDRQNLLNLKTRVWISKQHECATSSYLWWLWAPAAVGGGVRWTQTQLPRRWPETAADSRGHSAHLQGPVFYMLLLLRAIADKYVLNVHKMLFISSAPLWHVISYLPMISMKICFQCSQVWKPRCRAEDCGRAASCSCTKFSHWRKSE